MSRSEFFACAGFAMPGLTVESLDAAQKALNAALRSDPTQLDTLTKGIDGLREAIASGYDASPSDLSDVLDEAVLKTGETYDPELSDVIGEVVIQKSDSAPAGTFADAPDPLVLFSKANAMNDPFAPILRTLHDELFTDDGTIRKSGDAVKTAFQKAYEDSLGAGDGIAEGAVNATVEELVGANPSLGHGLDREYDDEGPENDEDQMEKFLKTADPALVAHFTKMQSRIDALQTERDLERFTKQAEDLGEGAAFGKTLMTLHNNNDPAVYEEITKRLSTKNQLLRKSDAWSREIGGGGANGGEASSAVAQLNARAQEMIGKGVT